MREGLGEADECKKCVSLLFGMLDALVNVGSTSVVTSCFVIKLSYRLLVR